MPQQKDSKVPAIRSNGFTKSWNEKTLGQVATFSKGQGYSKKDLTKSGTPIVMYGRLYTDYETEITDVNTFVLEEPDSTKSKGNEVVVPASGETAEDIARASAISNAGLILGGDLNVISPSSDVVSYFLALSLSHGTAQQSLARKAQGKSVVHLRNSDLESLEVPFPELPEQTQIGVYFKSLDRMIGLHQRKHDKLVTLKQAMLQNMFPQDGATTPEIRFKGFKDDWEAKPLEQLATFSKGQGYSKKDLTKAGTPIILYGRLYTAYQTEIADVNTFACEQPGAVKSDGSEVVVPSSGETAEDIARASAVLQEGVILGGDLNVISPSDELHPCFLALSLSNGESKKNLARKAQGKSVVHVRNSDLENLDIPVPELTEQKKIGTYFRNLDELITKHATQLEKLKNIKSACLEKMFV